MRIRWVWHDYHIIAEMRIDVDDMVLVGGYYGNTDLQGLPRLSSITHKHWSKRIHRLTKLILTCTYCSFMFIKCSTIKREQKMNHVSLFFFLNLWPTSLLCSTFPIVDYTPFFTNFINFLPIFVFTNVYPFLPFLKNYFYHL